MKFQRRVFLGAAAFGGLGALPGVFAQAAYPVRPVKVIVPFAAGGATDFFARRICDDLRRELDQPFVIDNRPGAGAVLGASAAAKSPADGYTLLFMTNSLCLQEAVNPPAKNYVLTKDFATVAGLYNLDLVLAVNSALPVRSVAELIAYARARPGQLNYASAGVGTTLHLAMELFKQVGGVDIVHIPYKDAPGARLDLVGGTIHMMVDTANTALALAADGKVRILAQTGLTRSASMPNVPTAAESGLPNYQANSFAGLLAPQGTPPAALERLRAGLATVLSKPDLRAAWQKQGATVIEAPPLAFQRLMQEDVDQWTRLLRDTKLKLS